MFGREPKRERGDGGGEKDIGEMTRFHVRREVQGGGKMTISFSRNWLVMSLPPER